GSGEQWRNFNGIIIAFERFVYENITRMLFVDNGVSRHIAQRESNEMRRHQPKFRLCKNPVNGRVLCEDEWMCIGGLSYDNSLRILQRILVLTIEFIPNGIGNTRIGKRKCRDRDTESRQNNVRPFGLEHAPYYYC